MRTRSVRRWLGVGITLALTTAGVAVTASPAYAANLVANPGFEGGSLSPWSCSAGRDTVQGSTVHSGAAALQGSPTSSDTAQCSQTVAVVPGAAYTLTAWARGGGGYAYLGITGGPSTWSTSAAGAWTQLTVSYTAGASQTSLQLFVHGWYGQPAYYVDDVDLEGPGGSSAPSTPGTPTAGTVTNTSATLSWGASAGTVTAYRVYEGSTVRATVTGTSTTITGLTACTAHTYTVTAYNSVGESPHSGAVTATTTGCTSPPGTPGTPAVGTVTPNSVALSWGTSSGTVTGYRVYEGSTVRATVTGTSTTITGLTACTGHTYTVTAYNSVGESPHSGDATATTTGCGSTGTPYPFAPYVDTDQRQDVAALATSGNTHYLTLAFMLANGSSCSPGWNGGTRDQTWINTLTSNIATIRAGGGDVIVSFGGENGEELAQACTTVSALTSAYASVVDTYHLTHIDFDVEGAAVSDTASINRRSQALAALEQSHPGLSVSLTLPVEPTGLDGNGLAVVQSARTYGLTLSVVNVMAMDYGQYAAPDGNQMGAYTQQAAQATHDQLATVYPNLTDTQLWAMVGVTPMIGVNDTCWSTYCELFTVNDATSLVTFARAHHLGRLAMWSMTRDKQCVDSSGNPVTHTYADATCSSILQSPYAFSHTFAGYTG